MNKRSEDTRKKGDIAEKLFELECIKRDIEAFVPVNSGGRADYIVFEDGCYKRVQIKYISVYNERLAVSFTKPQNGRKNSEGKQLYKKYSSDEIDLFLVYCPDTELWYQIPVELMSTSRGIVLNLGITSPKNGQVKGVKYAKDYIW